MVYQKYAILENKMSKNKKDDSFGGQLSDLPNEKYVKFFATFDEIETLDVSQWRPSHILGYFCKKYQEQYNMKYNFKFNSPSPSKSFEIFQIKRMCVLLSSKPSILKEYIDWIYQTKVIQAKRRLTSISFMTNENVLKEYKLNVLLSDNRSSNVDRSTALPDKYKTIFDEAGSAIQTYGDLCFISQMDPMSFELIVAFEKIEALGFDKEILKRIV